MSYSCSDFTDDILTALHIDVPEEDCDSPSKQADMALDKIQAFRDLAIGLRDFDVDGIARMNPEAVRQIVQLRSVATALLYSI